MDINVNLDSLRTQEQTISLSSIKGRGQRMVGASNPAVTTPVQTITDENIAP